MFLGKPPDDYPKFRRLDSRLEDDRVPDLLHPGIFGSGLAATHWYNEALPGAGEDLADPFDGAAEV